MNPESRYLQELIIAELGVPWAFDVDNEVAQRVEFLADRLRRTGATAYVLGISGGVDSATAGRLCQLAVERVRTEGGQATFVAMRLPYGVQADEADAPALARVHQVRRDPGGRREAGHRRHGRGSAALRPRSTVRTSTSATSRLVERMVAQYLVAGARGGLVVGTDHAAEAVMGFFTKYGDGACDLTPLSGLSKRRVRDGRASGLGASPEITGKVPTADLETNNPGVPDEAVLGVTLRRRSTTSSRATTSTTRPPARSSRRTAVRPTNELYLSPSAESGGVGQL